jgi:hypothetical protein
MLIRGKRSALATIGLVATLVAGVTWMMTSSAGAAPAEAPAESCATPSGCPPGASREVHELPPPEESPLALMPFSRRLTIKAGPGSQTVTLTGTGFLQGLSVRVVGPMGEFVTTYSGRSMGEVTPTSVRIPARLETRGTYVLSVRNPDGTRSNEITLAVR